MSKVPTDRATMREVLQHPYLDGAEGMREQWVSEFARYTSHMSRVKDDPF